MPLPPLQRLVHTRLSRDKGLDVRSQLLHILVPVGLDFQDLSVQAVVAVSPVSAVHLVDGQAQVFVGNDLLVNSNSFHQDIVSSL